MTATAELYPKAQVAYGDAFGAFLTGTMGGGTALVRRGAASDRPDLEEHNHYVMVRTSVILEYERAIHELRRELLHYRHLFLQSARTASFEDPYEPILASVDAASARVLNSVLSAQIPDSAFFADFAEGEL
jgi:hypothetical protein